MERDHEDETTDDGQGNGAHDGPDAGDGPERLRPSRCPLAPDYRQADSGRRDVLVRVHAAALHIGDSFGVRGAPLLMRMVTGLFRPKPGVPGFDVAGVVEAVGSGVTTFRPGDAVFGASHGTCAEFVSAPAGQLALKPTNLTFEQAAAVPTSALAALHGLRDAGGLNAWTEGAHQRCGRRHWHLRDPDCQGIWRECHGSVQHVKRGPCPFAGRRCRD